MSLNKKSKDDEIFLKEFLKDFYRQVIKMEHHSKFENTLTDWIQDYFNHNEKNSEMILKLMENHIENENWFSSLIGFFYENGLSDNNNNNNDNIIINYNNITEKKHLTS